jgi:hypothetical protein
MQSDTDVRASDAQEARAFLYYDSNAGRFAWLRRFPGMVFRDRRVDFKGANIFNAKWLEKPVCGVLETGYPFTSLLEYTFTAHRLAWLLHYGVWPEGEIDHINGDRSDFRITNLRDVTRQENVLNSRKISSWANPNTGVRQKKGGRWEARIMYRYQSVFIGVFDTKAAAVVARRAKEIELRGVQPWQTL